MTLQLFNNSAINRMGHLSTLGETKFKFLRGAQSDFASALFGTWQQSGREVGVFALAGSVMVALKKSLD